MAREVLVYYIHMYDKMYIFQLSAAFNKDVYLEFKSKQNVIGNIAIKRKEKKKIKLFFE